ncbi:MAG: hypothetical protein CVU56_05035 [Deltaproteobacteria bacterium HGW-Deltaproteobacteria-14]|jgi:DNA polymerase (family 10)|nr:MAG: hypothetical protein CVU56_05035 [Deltaproteobacteria bacterium HGW-Deltaproteobacteria-14]
MTERSVAEVLKRLGFGYDFLGEHPMRARAFSNAARTLKKLPDVATAFAAGELDALPGIGPGVLDVVARVVRGEAVPALDDVEARIPPGLFDIAQLKGLGPKKVRTLHDDLGVSTVAELEYAVNENRLLALSGFGPKTQEGVAAALAALRARAGRYRLDQGLAAAEREAERLRALPFVHRVAVAGDVRRGLEIVEDVVLVVHLDPDGEPALAAALGGARGEADGLYHVVYAAELPVRVVTCPWEDLFGVVLLRATGSPGHVAALEARAADAGAIFGPVGLYRGSERVPCPDEGDVYAALGLHPTAPERREEEVPLVALGQSRPRLLRRRDLRGALHNHTTASDGIHGLGVMRDAAKALGLGWLGISEHSQSAAYAGGLDAAALGRQIEEIARLNAAAPDGCALLTGVESDILRDGELDYPAAVLAQLDVVVASVHTRFRQTPDEMTVRMVNAASQPYADVIGHPTGRLLLGRAASPYDVEALLDACAASGCAVELNANPQRLDLDARHLAMAKERGVKVSIAADAHSAPALAHLDFGVTVARRAGLLPEDVLNCLELAELRAWLAARKARARGHAGA